MYISHTNFASTSQSNTQTLHLPHHHKHSTLYTYINRTKPCTKITMKNTSFFLLLTLHELFQWHSQALINVTARRLSYAYRYRVLPHCDPHHDPQSHPWRRTYPLMGGRAVVPAVEDAERRRRCTAAISSVLRFSTFCWCSLRISRSFTRWTSFCISR